MSSASFWHAGLCEAFVFPYCFFENGRRKKVQWFLCIFQLDRTTVIAHYQLLVRGVPSRAIRLLAYAGFLLLFLNLLSSIFDVKVLHPVCHVRALHLWTAVYLPTSSPCPLGEEGMDLYLPSGSQTQEFNSRSLDR